MTQTHLRWIRMPLPVHSDWKQTFINDLHPLLEAADATGVVNQWYFKRSYQRGTLLDVYIQTDSTALHSVLRPILEKRFGAFIAPEHPSKLLASLSPRFKIVPADIEEDPLTDLHVISTQLVAGNSLGQTDLGNCFSEISAALGGLDRDSEWISAFAKTQLGNWLDQYFINRDASDQLISRQLQEVELLSFLGQQQAIEQSVLFHAQKIGWIEGFQVLDCRFDGEDLIAKAIQAHITRYCLTDLQVGQMWLAFAKQGSTSYRMMSAQSCS